jgi:hypothetical protein
VLLLLLLLHSNSLCTFKITGDNQSLPRQSCLPGGHSVSHPPPSKENLQHGLFPSDSAGDKIITLHKYA